MEYNFLGYTIIYDDNCVHSISTTNRNLTWDLANLWTNILFESYKNHVNNKL
jgi:hypothetical protein